MSSIAELSKDPRWRRLNDRHWVCPCCNQAHGGLFDLVVNNPIGWTVEAQQRVERDGQRREHCLLDDICAIDDKFFFVRCVLELPLLGIEQGRFGFGVWSSLSRDNFARYVETFDGGEQGSLGPMFGWFSNSLAGYPETLNLKCYVHPQNGRRRPLIELEPTDHPLAVEQRDGLTFDRVLDIYAAAGHDLRPHLEGT